MKNLLTTFTMTLLFVAVNAQQQAPPAYTGTGIEWQLKKGKYYLKSVLPHSPADGKIPASALKKTWLASVKNETTGKRYATGGSEQDLLAAITGPEKSVCSMELVLPGKKGMITLAVPLGLYFNTTNAKEYAICTETEKQYIAAHFPWNYVQDERPPNRDNDSLPDSKDKCPELWGPAVSGGCPTDRDGDGVYDHNDRCVDVAGHVLLYGCPETDKDEDGIPDDDDDCPYIPGWSAGAGCDELADTASYDDEDEDEVPDDADDCPEIWGPLHNKGCPDETPLNLPDTYWSSLLRLMIAAADETDTLELKGPWQSTLSDSSQVYALNLVLSGIDKDKAWCVVENSGSVRYCMDFGYTQVYREALRYYSALATAMHGLSYDDSLYAANLTFTFDQLMYTPETPLLQFTPDIYCYISKTAILNADKDVLRDIESYIGLTLGIYELENNEGERYYAVRMWVN